MDIPVDESYMMTKLRAYLDVMRLKNCLLAFIAVFAGAYITQVTDVLSWKVLYACLSAFLITAFGNAINDYYDWKVDEINNPDRPIPRGDLKLNEAKNFSLILLVGGLIIPTFLLNWMTTFIALVSAILLYGYSYVLKWRGFVGNLATSFLVGLTFLYGWSLYLTPWMLWNIFLLSLLSFLANMGREVMKGIADLEGDSIHGVGTLAVKSGKKFSSVVASVFILASVAFSPIPYYFGIVKSSYLALVLIVDAILLISCLSILLETSKETAKKTKDFVRIGMLGGLIAFLLGTSFEMTEVLMILMMIAPFITLFASSLLWSKHTAAMEITSASA